LSSQHTNSACAPVFGSVFRAATSSGKVVGKQRESIGSSGRRAEGDRALGLSSRRGEQSSTTEQWERGTEQWEHWERGARAVEAVGQQQAMGFKYMGHTVTPSRRVAFMPTSALSSMVQACMVEEWPACTP